MTSSSRTPRRIAPSDSLRVLGDSIVGDLAQVAFDVPSERFDEYVEKLHAKGIPTSHVLNHDESPMQVSATMHPGVFVRSVYFMDQDGILLEFACWTRVFDASDVKHRPATAADAEQPLTATRA